MEGGEGMNYILIFNILFIALFLSIMGYLWSLEQEQEVGEWCDKVAKTSDAFEHHISIGIDFIEKCHLRICHIKNGKMVCHKETIIRDKESPA